MSNGSNSGHTDSGYSFMSKSFFINNLSNIYNQLRNTLYIPPVENVFKI